MDDKEKNYNTKLSQIMEREKRNKKESLAEILFLKNQTIFEVSTICSKEYILTSQVNDMHLTVTESSNISYFS